MRSLLLSTNAAWKIRSLTKPLCYVQSAAYMKLKPPKKYIKIEYPQRRKLRMMEKIPAPIHNTISHAAVQQKSEAKYCRGPETIHNKLVYGQFGVQALDGGFLNIKHIETWRLFVNSKLNENMFARWRIDTPWKPVTAKGIGKRMGKGKSPISHYVIPVKADRIIFELGGQVNFQQVYKILRHVARQCPFEARIVSFEILEKEKQKEKWITENNLNPFSYKYCAKNNFLGIKKDLSPYDLIWYGKY